MCEIKRAKRFSHALVHFVTARASVFTDHRMSGPPIRAKNLDSRTISEHTLDTSPTEQRASQEEYEITLDIVRIVVSACAASSSESMSAE